MEIVAGNAENVGAVLKEKEGSAMAKLGKAAATSQILGFSQDDDTTKAPPAHSQSSVHLASELRKRDLRLSKDTTDGFVFLHIRPIIVETQLGAPSRSPSS